jgi:YesN/AraC family two-component response regulator
MTPPHLLLVEDDPELSANLEEWLTASGYRVAGAADGAEAIALVSERPFDVIVTDLKMPRVDGLGLLRWIKETQRPIPVIFLSGQASIHDAIQALREFGGFDFLVKPLEDLNQLNQAIERALASKVLPLALPSAAVESEDNPVVGQALEVIRTYFREAIGLAEISAMLGYTPTYLTTLMQRETGRTVQQWIIHERLQLSKQLLAQTDWSLNRIAIEVGYSNQTHFGRQFKQSLGQTPSAWREAALREASAAVHPTP